MLQGELAVRVQNFKRPSSGPDFKKGYFELELGLKVQGTFVSLARIPEWSLNESREGQLYAAGPSRPMIQRGTDGTYTILEDPNGKQRYSQLFLFAKDGEGEGSRFTPEAFEFKNLINDAAILAYQQLSQERTGVGAQRTAPAGVATAVNGTERGFPGAVDDDLPF